MIINAAGPCRWTYSWNLQTKTLCNPSQNPNYKVHSKIEQINLAKEPLPIYKILWRNDWPCTYKKKCWKLSEHLLLKLFGLMWADERVLKCYKFWSIGHVLPPYSLETLVKVFRPFRLERIVLLFRVGRCTTSHLLAGPACLWCLVSCFISLVFVHDKFDFGSPIDAKSPTSSTV
jgi:hypothetical protein